MLSELDELDSSSGWVPFFQKLNWKAKDNANTQKIAKLPENRLFNRYRDVLPYDQSRVVLKEGDTDYINANLVEVPSVNRRYILTQGPLKNTIAHFWQMVWEQKSQAIIMLNRVIEKNQIKCHQYWPCGEKVGHTDVMEIGCFRITYIEESMSEFFTVRTLEIFNMKEEEKRKIYHFHYLHWPDFGVPTSPATFLSFLFEARNAGVLSSDVGPAVIHCSAGIGRSGTYILVDSILKEVEQTRDLDNIDVKKALLQIRRYRVGLIQTPDQLRFTYAAILEGTRMLLPRVYGEALDKFLNERDPEEEEVSEEDEVPPPIPARKRQEVDKAVDAEANIAPKRKRTLPDIPTESTPSPAETPKDSPTAVTPDSSKGVSSYQSFQEGNVSSDESDGEDEIIDLSASSSSSPEDEESMEDGERLEIKGGLPTEDDDQRYQKQSEEQDLKRKSAEDDKRRKQTIISHETEEENIELEVEEELEGEVEDDEDFRKPKLETTREMKSESATETTVQEKLMDKGMAKSDKIQDKPEDKNESEESTETAKMNAIRMQEGVVDKPKPMESGSDLMESGHGDYGRVIKAEKIVRPANEPSNESIGGSLGTNPRKSEPEIRSKEGKDDQATPTDEDPQPSTSTESAAELRRRQRQEKKEKTEKLVKDIKANVKWEEDTRWIRKIIRNSLIAIGVCAAAYVAYRCYRYFFRALPRRKFRRF